MNNVLLTRMDKEWAGGLTQALLVPDGIGKLMSWIHTASGSQLVLAVIGGALATLLATVFTAAAKSGFSVFRWRTPSTNDIVLLAQVKDQESYTAADKATFQHDGLMFPAVIAITLANSTDVPLYVTNATFVPKQATWQIGRIALRWHDTSVHVHHFASRRPGYKLQPAIDLKFPGRRLEEPWRKDKLIRVNERGYTFIPLRDDQNVQELQEAVGTLGTLILSYSTRASFGSMKLKI